MGGSSARSPPHPPPCVLRISLAQTHSRRTNQLTVLIGSARTTTDAHKPFSLFSLTHYNYYCSITRYRQKASRGHSYRSCFQPKTQRIVKLYASSDISEKRGGADAILTRRKVILKFTNNIYPGMSSAGAIFFLALLPSHTHITHTHTYTRI